MYRLILLFLVIAASGAQGGELKADILGLIAGQKATYGIAFKDLQSGETLLINENDVMHAASTMKTPVMLRLFDMIESGTLSLRQLVLIRNEFKSIVDGSLYSITVDSEENLYQHVGKKLPVMTLIEAMIIHSSNLATNLLIQLADAEQTTMLMRSFGAKDILVLRGVEDLKAYEANRNNVASAADMLTVMEACLDGKRYREENLQRMWNILSRQAFNEMIPAGIPKDSGAIVAHKTGSISRVEHDAAIVKLADGHRYILVIFSRDFGDEAGRKQVHATAAKVSERIYRHVTATVD